MSANIRFDDGSPEAGAWVFALASNHGLRLLGDWVAGLPAGKFPALAALIDDGEVRGTDTLAQDLAGAVKASKPKGGVASTVKGLAGLVGVGDPGETALIVGDDEGGTAGKASQTAGEAATAKSRWPR
jgi:hypothetical protein